jgi:hypothetical protein
MVVLIEYLRYGLNRRPAVLLQMKPPYRRRACGFCPDIPSNAGIIAPEQKDLQDDATLREAIHRVASLGGFFGRKSDGEPGTQTRWLGLQRLDDIVTMCCFMTGATETPVSSRFDSG